MTRWSLFLQTLSLLHHFLGLYSDGGTRLTYRFEGGAKNPFFKLLMPLFMPILNRNTKKNYRKLKGILESRA